MSVHCTFIVVVAVLAAWTPWSIPGAAAAEAQVRVGKDPFLVDSLVDNVMAMVQRELSRSGFDVTELPDVTVTNGRLTLSGSDGMLKGLSSIYRSADGAAMEVGQGNVSLSSSFSLSTLVISYKVSARYLFVSVTNDVSATFRLNRLRATAGMFYEGDSCYVGVQSIDMDVLEDVNWRVSGFGAIEGLVSATLNRLAPPSSIKAQINASLKQGTRGFRTPCHYLIPGMDKNLNWNC